MMAVCSCSCGAQSTIKIQDAIVRVLVRGEEYGGVSDFFGCAEPP